MARIALTGAAGDIGSELLDAFDGTDHELRPFVHSETDDVDGELLDVTDPEAVERKIDDVDVVIHLAGAAAVDTDWDTAVETNVHGTKHVLDAAVQNGVDRVVFASSNHAVGTYNTLGEDDVDRSTAVDARTIDHDVPSRPDSFYGVSKVTCEALGNYYADEHELEVVNLRIGWFLTEAELEAKVDPGVDSGGSSSAAAMWLSPRDCRDVHRAAATADLPESPVTLNAVSRNDDRIHAITETMRVLGYRPRDNSAEVLDHGGGE